MHHQLKTQTLFLDERYSLDRTAIYMDETGELFAGTDLAENDAAIEVSRSHHRHEMGSGKFIRVADIYDCTLNKAQALRVVEEYKKGLPVAVDHAPWRNENHPAHRLNALYPNRPKSIMALAAKVFQDDAELVSAYERQQQTLPPPKEDVPMVSPFAALKHLI